MHGQDEPARWSLVARSFTVQDDQDLLPLLSGADAVIITADPDLRSRLARIGVPEAVLDGQRFHLVRRPRLP